MLISNGFFTGDRHEHHQDRPRRPVRQPAHHRHGCRQPGLRLHDHRGRAV